VVEALVVLMDGVVAGTLSRGSSGLQFVYAPGYSDDATPLSLSMPTSQATHQDKSVTPWLWGLLPDDPDVLRRWGREFEVPSNSPFTLLATPIGEDCAGGVQFASFERAERLLASDGEIRWIDTPAIGERLKALRSDRASWLGPALTGQWSLAGAQAKMALRCVDGRWGETSGVEPTTHILKPAIMLEDHELNEHLCLAAARMAGLPTAHSEVLQFGDQIALVVERYDRIEVAGRLRRVHQEDLIQALGYHPSQKYQADGGPGVAQIGELFSKRLTEDRAEDAARRFADALAWNWIMGGTDAHAKNYSLLLSGRDVRLAPLYDIASILPYPDVYVPKLKMAMKLGGHYDIRAHSRKTWVKVASELKLNAETLVQRVQELATAAPSAFREAAAAPSLSTFNSAFSERLCDAVADRAADCLRVLS
jgi:serine/threonine-protein kinase HipA